MTQETIRTAQKEKIEQVARCLSSLLYSNNIEVKNPLVLKESASTGEIRALLNDCDLEEVSTNKCLFTNFGAKTLFNVKTVTFE